MNKLSAVIVPALLVVFGSHRVAYAQPSEAVLTSIETWERAGYNQPPDGDNGLAIGTFQIHRCVWIDVSRFAPSVIKGYKYTDCRTNAVLSRNVARAYLKHYVKTGSPAEHYYRCWNGGPKWATKTGKARANLDKYVKHVQSVNKD